MLLLGTRQQLSKIPHNFTIQQIGDELIKAVQHANNPGVTFDANLSLKKLTNKLESFLYLTLHNIYGIIKNLNLDTARLLVQSLVLSKLDYCISLMTGTSKDNILKLQRIQNMAC